MATKNTTSKKKREPRFTPRSLGDTIELALAMAGPGALQVVEATVARLDDKYSLRNRIAVAVQRPDATEVGGKGYWREAGYRPGKGQKGLAIFFKSGDRKKKTEDETETGPTPKKEPVDKTAEERAARRWSGYGITYVWDRAQVVPLRCECTGDCQCPPPPNRPVTPAGRDGEGFAEMVALALESADQGKEPGE